MFEHRDLVLDNEDYTSVEITQLHNKVFLVCTGFI
jgi:hypothetical protein